MNKRGFTLIEALAVIVLVGLLAALIGSKVMSSVKEAKEKTADSNANSLVSVLENFYYEKKMSTAFTGCFIDYDNEVGTCDGLSFGGKQPDAGFVLVSPDGIECDFNYGNLRYFCENGNVTRYIPITDPFTFSYTGEYKEFKAPRTGSYKLEVWGAQGGYRSDSSKAGKGGYATGIINLTKGDILYVYVGGSGNSGTCTNSICTGGFNGGGYRYNYKGGGGATDIRFVSNSNAVDATSLLSRVIVAGGGGSDGSTGNSGGVGGGSTAGNTSGGYGTGGYGGTQTGFTTSTTVASSQYKTNGSGNYYAGFGFGGFGVSQSGGYGGAGGGGWYGGVGALPDSSADDDKGGGGGSGFVYTASSSVPTGYSVSNKYILTNTSLVAGNASMPTQNGSSTMTGNTGNGYAKITYLESERKVILGVGDKLEYSFTNSEQVLSINQNGYYRLEVWGASGGSYNQTYHGGYGGYSRGTVYLSAGSKVYINVGGSPINSTAINEFRQGGYNGGGQSEKRSDAVFNAGGGATHIALKSGVLSDLEDYKGEFDSDAGTYRSNDILIVAGGGGGGSYYSSSRYGVGGSGGGTTGSSGMYNDAGSSSNCEGFGYGGNQSTGGNYEIKSDRHSSVQNIDIPVAGFGFGSGADQSIGGSGGGGGFYGGRGTSCIGGAGGGSGYIGYSGMTNGVMYCYGCTEDNNSATKTINSNGSNKDIERCNSGFSSDPVSNCAKSGDGYAIITYMGE